MRALLLVLTSGCNLNCSYCFQNDKKGIRMDWDTMRMAVDLALGVSQPEIEIIFSGGEPLLEFPLMRRGVTHALTRCPPDKRVRFGLITNGTRFRDSIVDFLAEHEFELQVSFDGIPEVSAIRGQGTFAILERKLARIRDRHPGFFSTVVVAAVVSPEVVKYLGDSAAYFLAEGYEGVAVSPVFTDSSTWDDRGLKVLDEQFSRMYSLSLEHYLKTGKIPIHAFGARGKGSLPDKQGSVEMCGISSGVCPVVDVDGQIHACAAIVDSYQKLPSEFLRTRLRAMRLGDVRAGDFEKRIKALHVAAEETGLFHNKQDKYSSYGRCGECRYLKSCMICPTSIGHIPGNTDPNRVPDFLCTFNMVSIRYAEKFAQELRCLQSPESVSTAEARSRIRAFAEQGDPR